MTRGIKGALAETIYTLKSVSSLQETRNNGITIKKDAEENDWPHSP